MTFNTSQIEELQKPLNRAVVKERQQGNSKVSYVEAWHAIAEANRIFGFDNWSRETLLLEQTNRDLVTLIGQGGKEYQQWRVGYLAKVRITVGAGVTREGTGFGSGMAKPEAIGDAIESAAKEAESDAMKRALMTFGNPFGLALYDKTQSNVAVVQPERSIAVVAAEAAMLMCQTVEELDAWAKTNESMLASLEDGPDKKAIRQTFSIRKKALAPAKELA